MRKRFRNLLRHPKKELIKLLGGQVPKKGALPRAEPSRGNYLLVAKSDTPPATAPGRLAPGLTVTGYLLSEIGLGQAAREIAYAGDRARLPLSLRNLPLPGRENDTEFSSKCNSVSDRLANMLIIGAPSIRDMRDPIVPGRFNILYPYWELSGLPGSTLHVAQQFDEVWAPSRFIASAFAHAFDRPVHILRQPLRLPSIAQAPREARNELRFYTFFDYDSYSARKNPRAVVSAFQAAFSRRQKDVELVIKTRGQNDAGLRDWLMSTAENDSRIRVIDKTLDRANMDQLMRTCDVFVSLHRSEGFGFGAAEALAAGKAVIATDYGGTTDFINDQTGYPVTYSLISVKKGDYIDAEGQVWAEPNLEAAVAAFRAVYDQSTDASARASRGFALLKANHSHEAVGAVMKRMLADRGLM